MYYKDFVRRYQMIAPRALERLRSRAHEMTEVHLYTCIDDRIMTTPTSHFTHKGFVISIHGNAE